MKHRCTEVKRDEYLTKLKTKLIKVDNENEDFIKIKIKIKVSDMRKLLKIIHLLKLIRKFW